MSGSYNVGAQSKQKKSLCFLATPTAADDNHQVQDFGTCGHHLTKAQCDEYANVKGGKNNAATAADAEDKPFGCYKIEADATASPPVLLEFVYNSDATAKADAIACSADNPCICKY